MLVSERNIPGGGGGLGWDLSFRAARSEVEDLDV